MTARTVFISYARADKDYVADLYALLSAAGRRVWLDVHDIPPGVDWRQVMTPAIAEADAFVFVVSPDSLGSEWCASELEIAFAHGKPVVPIVLRDPNGAAVPPSLAAVPWLSARDADLVSRV